MRAARPCTRSRSSRSWAPASSSVPATPKAISKTANIAGRSTWRSGRTRAWRTPRRSPSIPPRRACCRSTCWCSGAAARRRSACNCSRCAWSRRIRWRARRHDASPRPRLRADRGAARDDPARGRSCARVRDLARGHRDGAAWRSDRATQRTHARGGTVPAPPHRQRASDRVRHEHRHRHAAPLRRRSRAHALRRGPAGLPRPRRPVPARTHDHARPRRPATGRGLHDGARRHHRGRRAAAQARSARRQTARCAVPLPRDDRRQSPVRMAGPLGQRRQPARAGRGHPARRGWPHVAADDHRAAARGRLPGSGDVSRALPVRMRGAALLLVLWLIALLTALVGAFALTASVEGLQGRVLHRGVIAGEVARAGLEYALVRAADPDPRRQWLPDGRPYHWTFGDARVDVSLVDENGKIDLNQADLPLLASLFQNVGGLENTQARALAAAVLDWRDPDSLTQPEGGAEDGEYAAAERPYGAKDAPFESVAELEQVLGMTPALYAKVAPDLTVYSGRTRPDPAFASAGVLQAMGIDAESAIARRRAWDPSSGGPAPVLEGGEPLVGSGSGTYSIDSRARLRDGREAMLRVVVRAGGNGLPGSAYTPLRWEEGASPR